MMLINSLSSLLFAVNKRQDERRAIPEVFSKRRERDETRHELTAASAFRARNVWKGYNARDKIFLLPVHSSAGVRKLRDLVSPQ
jgi:hypothetical protein